MWTSTSAFLANSEYSRFSLALFWEQPQKELSHPWWLVSFWFHFEPRPTSVFSFQKLTPADPRFVFSFFFGGGRGKSPLSCWLAFQGKPPQQPKNGCSAGCSRSHLPSRCSRLSKPGSSGRGQAFLLRSYWLKGTQNCAIQPIGTSHGIGKISGTFLGWVLKGSPRNKPAFGVPQFGYMPILSFFGDFYFGVRRLGRSNHWAWLFKPIFGPHMVGFQLGHYWLTMNIVHAADFGGDVSGPAKSGRFLFSLLVSHGNSTKALLQGKWRLLWGQKAPCPALSGLRSGAWYLARRKRGEEGRTRAKSRQENQGVWCQRLPSN